MTTTGRVNARTRAPLYTHSHVAGFTLIELLVSIAIFISVMAGVTLLLIGSTRVSQQGFQNQQAFEIARGAMGLMQRDLSRAFTSRNHGDFYNFYGTPIGFTFVGVTSPRDSGGANVARITYVIHRRPKAAVLRDVDGNQRFIYDLIRYVEPGAEDLDSFDVEWDLLFVTDVDGFQLQNLQSLIGNPDTGQPLLSAVADAILDGICDADDAPCLEQVAAAKRRELWIQMLSGMEPDSATLTFLPDLWAVLDNGAALDSLDYVLAENILSSVEPGDDAFATPMFTTDTMPFFEYAAFIDRTTDETGVVEDATNAAPIEITSPAHGLRTNRLVTVSGVGGNDAANDTHYVTVTGVNTFTLQASAGSGAYTQGGTWVEDGRAISGATTPGVIRITDLGHELTTGEEIVVSDVTGNFAANGRFVVNVFDLDQVDLVGSAANGTYTGGGTWIRVGKIEDALVGIPIVIADTDHGLQTGDEIVVTDVEINTAANGRWFVTRLDPNSFSLDNSQSNGVATLLTGDWIEAVDKDEFTFRSDEFTRLLGSVIN